MVEVYQYHGQIPVAGRKEIKNDFSRPLPIASVTQTPKTLLEEALEQVEGYTRRIIDLEIRIAALEAVLDKG